MAFGCLERARDRRLVQRMFGDLGGQLRGRNPIEWTEDNCRQQIAAFEISEQPSKRRVVLLFLPRRVPITRQGVPPAERRK